MTFGAWARWLAHRTGLPRALRESHLALVRVGARLEPPPRRRSEEPLRILAFTPTYLPDHRAGSEVTLHCLARALVERGHCVRVVVDEQTDVQALDGIEILAAPSRARALDAVRWSDVVLAQLERALPLRLATRVGRPFVYYVQIGNSDRRTIFGRTDLWIFNSYQTRSQHPWVDDGLVLHPIVREEDYVVTPGEAITLVNLARVKGGRLFFELATRLPDHTFLGVKGYGPQVEPAVVPPNVTLLEPQSDMRAVYGRTRVLLIPSVYESYGRVGLEAGVSGIPTVASPVPGLREALGDAALWADEGDVDGWVSHIRSLDDASFYLERSAIAREHFLDLDPAPELAELERRLRLLVGGRP